MLCEIDLCRIQPKHATQTQNLITSILKKIKSDEYAIICWFVHDSRI